jgi:hypothetical protein
MLLTVFEFRKIHIKEGYGFLRGGSEIAFARVP